METPLAQPPIHTPGLAFGAGPPSEPSSVSLSPSQQSARKRSLSTTLASPAPADEPENRRKARKVSRACDHCKSKKSKCTGLKPCENCIRRGLLCVYDAKYSRGRPPTPPPGPYTPASSIVERDKTKSEIVASVSRTERPHFDRIDYERASSNVLTDRNPSRGSPELEMAEIEGQVFDPTSGLTFLHRAWRRLSSQKRKVVPDVLNDAEKRQSLISAGDKPFTIISGGQPLFPDHATAQDLFNFYFEVCVVTYRHLHRHSVATWLATMETNVMRGQPLSAGIGPAKAAIVLTIFALATRRQAKIRIGMCSDDQEDQAFKRSDQYFCDAVRLTDAEVGLPRLESAQARLIQVLFLLQTSRMSQGWYVFGHTVQIISALGLHRRAGRIRHAPSSSSKANYDYINAQCRKRTLWVAYTIDKMLAVVLGRPRHYHDDDIDQDFPDAVNDDDMTLNGPRIGEPAEDCHIDALVYHAKLSQIIGEISTDVYSIKRMPKRDRLVAAHRHGKALHEWKTGLPPQLGTIRPGSLIPSFRRQATALKLAYAHAVMHANRPFLLGGFSSSDGSDERVYKDAIDECIEAARVALETVDSIAADAQLFYALWWSHYVTFCALAVVYVWEIQQRQRIPPRPTSRAGWKDDKEEEALVRLSDLAERCQGHLVKATAQDSPSRRYNIILEELRMEARHQSSRGPGQPPPSVLPSPAIAVRGYDMNGPIVGHFDHIGSNQTSPDLGMEHQLYAASAGLRQAPIDMSGVNSLLDEWQPADWLDLDSSAYAPFPPDMERSPVLWMSSPAN